MRLWLLWWEAIWLLRSGCTHLRTFSWFTAIVAGLTIRTESLGVTSIVRTLGLSQHGIQGRQNDRVVGTGRP